MMMNSTAIKPLLFFFFLLLQTTYLASSLNQDGILLLSFKNSILSDPLSSLHSWSYTDDTPCTWNGVTCTGFPDPTTLNATSRVISLLLPNSQLLGSLPSDLGLIQHLRHLDLSDNILNGTLPTSLFRPSELKILSLANNEISGQIPDLFRNLTRLELLNLSDNALSGGLPASLSLAPNVSVVSLSNNYLSGGLSGLRFGRALKVLDLSSNLLNGTLPPGLVTSTGAQFLNLSSNRLSGEIPSELGSVVLLDLSGNGFTGEVPVSLVSQKPAAFAGNPDLCGKPLKNMCSIRSSLSGPPNPESPPALAAIPNTTTTTTRGVGSSADNDGGLRSATIVAIVVGDLGGIALLLAIFLFVYRVKKRKKGCCGVKKTSHGQADTSESTSTSTSEEAEEEGEGRGVELQGAILVTVDGDTELEMETLLKASAYILGATSSTIVYKAVLADGTALAVRRIGESRAVEKVKDLEALVRSIAKLRHPNLVRIWGFYSGPEEKLLIHDYAPNGSLKKSASSPLNLNLEARLKIARGIARGLAYIHEKKSVHGNIKPSNILLDSDMEAKIGDFGLDRLSTSGKPTSARLFGSKRSIQSQGSVPESSPVPGSSLSYQAPESLQNLKPNAKWDVYSFGVVLLELIAGRVFAEEELSQWSMGFVTEERNRILRMADPALRGEVVQGREEVLLSCFKLGFACANVAPQKRPTMKDAAMTLDRIPSTSTSTSSSVRFHL